MSDNTLTMIAHNSIASVHRSDKAERLVPGVVHDVSPLCGGPGALIHSDLWAPETLFEPPNRIWRLSSVAFLGPWWTMSHMDKQLQQESADDGKSGS